MATTTSFNYTGGNRYLESLISDGKWTSGAGTTVIKFSFRQGADPYNYNGIPTGKSWNVIEKQGMIDAFAAWEAVANLDFQEATTANEADVWLWLGTQTELGGALGWSNLPQLWSPSPLYMAFAYDADGWDAGGLAAGGFGYVVALHELGHQLGLGHTHDTSGGTSVFPGVSAPFDDFGSFDLNQGIFTVMSYNDGWASEYPYHQPYFGDTDYGYNLTPGALDIAAIQEMYGANMSHATGDDLYTLPDANVSGTGWSTIWDAGGSDTISAEGSTRDFIIDLRPAPLVGQNAGGFVSYSAGIVGGFTIANGVVIEAAHGGDGDDLLIGTANGDELFGNGGADTIEAGNGADTVNGGDGHDVLTFVTWGGNVRIDLLNAAVNTGHAAGDQISEVEEFWTGDRRDVMRGDNSSNVFVTGGGSDLILARSGDDTIIAGDGADLICGNLGADVMTGGQQTGVVDIFRYHTRNDSGVGAGNRDIITDFETGTDVIYLRRLDANFNQAGRQDFVFVGYDALSGTAGEVSYRHVGGDTLIDIDRDGDGLADMQIELTGTMALTADDFIF